MKKGNSEKENQKIAILNNNTEKDNLKNDSSENKYKGALLKWKASEQGQL